MLWAMVLEKILRVPWTARRSNQSILNEISPENSLEGLMLKLKLQYFGHLMQRTDSLEKNPGAGKDWGWEEKGTTEDEMFGWYYWLNGHEFEQAPSDCDGQWSLACCNPWGCKESDTTEWLNWSELKLWRFPLNIGRTDPEAETPILWPPDMRNWLIGKDHDAGKD